MEIRLATQGVPPRRSSFEIWCTAFVVDGRVDSNEAPGTEQSGRVDPNAVADTYWNITQQTKSCWTSELDLKPSVDIRAQGKAGPGKQEN